MILTCPSCRARYAVPDSALGSSGRKVRCAQCRFSWFQDGVEPALAARPPVEVRRAPPPPSPQPPPAPQSAAPRAAAAAAPAPRRDPAPRPAPPPEPAAYAAYEEDGGPYDDEPEAGDVRPVVSSGEPIDWTPAAPDPADEAPSRRPRRNPARLWTAFALIAAVLMVAALAAVYYLGPQQISAWIGGDAAPAGETLRFTRRDVTREPLPTDNELLTVTGEITNVAQTPQRLPQIRAEVTDAEGRAIFFWMIAPPVTELQPGQAVTFSSASTDVPKGGRNLNLSFGPAR